MLPEPSEPSASQASVYEKDLVAWNLPRPRPSEAPEWRTRKLDPSASELGHEGATAHISSEPELEEPRGDGPARLASRYAV